MKLIKITSTLLMMLAAIFFMTSCNRDKAGISFNLAYSTDFTVKKSSPISLPMNILSPPITSNSEAEFEKNNTRADKVVEVKALTGTLTITAPSGSTFSFAKDAYLYINADGLSENLIAFKENIGNDETITLDLPNVDLAPYIKASTFTLRLKVTTDETLTKDIDINANVLFRIKANPLK